MRRKSEAHGKSIADIFTEEGYERLKEENGYWFNLEKDQIEDIPNIIYIPNYDIVCFAVHMIKGHKCVVIHDFIDTIFPFGWLHEMTYAELLKKLQERYQK